ncbi:hypothetical protein DM01DRAFT_1178325 [Hesseltinella vesiculosa]|uniref:Uncharacterized protein n=1 Tax=Hesseltinella vesiculosa TaxID=101127 RepID=A0A1X2G4H6_9FUNG|nr:hypothetical protein DM01DRAFT_1178325 [Hesseltinella vesiculosa]
MLSMVGHGCTVSSLQDPNEVHQPPQGCFLLDLRVQQLCNSSVKLRHALNGKKAIGSQVLVGFISHFAGRFLFTLPHKNWSDTNSLLQMILATFFFFSPLSYLENGSIQQGIDKPSFQPACALLTIQAFQKKAQEWIASNVVLSIIRVKEIKYNKSIFQCDAWLRRLCKKKKK